MLFGECEKVIVRINTQWSLGHVYESEERRGDSGTLSRQRCCVPIPWAAHLYRFGGEAGHKVKTPVRGRMHSPTTAFCARGHVVEHRVNMVMRSPKSEHNPGSE
jgi:hypothetical protein